VIATDSMPPAPGQGALAITCRTNDAATRDAFSKVTIPEFEIATTAERAFLDALDGSCRTPIGALATVEKRRLNFIGEVLTPDGAKRWRRTASIDLEGNFHQAADNVGRRLGAEIRNEAGSDFQPDKIDAW
jgi:hydroxymethylbilane synthase